MRQDRRECDTGAGHHLHKLRIDGYGRCGFGWNACSGIRPLRLGNPRRSTDACGSLAVRGVDIDADKPALQLLPAARVWPEPQNRSSTTCPAG